jgi:hypothetical protein
MYTTAEGIVDSFASWQGAWPAWDTVYPYDGSQFQNTSGAPLTITALGRVFAAGDHGTHTIALISLGYDAPNGIAYSYKVLAQTTITMGVANGAEPAVQPYHFQFVDLATPIVIPPSSAESGQNYPDYCCIFCSEPDGDTVLQTQYYGLASVINGNGIGYHGVQTLGTGETPSSEWLSWDNSVVGITSFKYQSPVELLGS